MIHRLTSGLCDCAARSVVDRSLPACRVMLPGGRTEVAGRLKTEALVYQSGVPAGPKLIATPTVTKKSPLESSLSLFRYNIGVEIELKKNTVIYPTSPGSSVPNASHPTEWR